MSLERWQECRVCSGRQAFVFSANMLRSLNVSYFLCERCGFLSTEKPHWLAEAYCDALADIDTGAAGRSVELARKVSSLLFCLYGMRRDYQCLDMGGGHGLMGRLLRDNGFDFYWCDPHAENIFLRGFEHADGKRYEVITAVEVLEHTEDPLAFLSDVLAVKCKERSVIIFTTQTFSGPPPPTDWWYYAFDSGQHISFFQERTLDVLARALGLRYVRVSGLHVFCRDFQRLGLARLLTRSKVAWLMEPVIRRVLGSRTMSDHEHLLRA